MGDPTSITPELLREVIADTAESVITVRPGDRLLLLWREMPSPELLQEFADQWAEYVPDVKCLHLHGPDQIVHQPADSVRVTGDVVEGDRG